MGILLVALVGFAGCCSKPPGKEGAAHVYSLPEAHADNLNPLKEDFFREPFRDLNDESVRVADLQGAPLIVVMFPSFRTEGGRRSLVELEAVLKRRGGSPKAVVVPVEEPEIVRPSIVSEPVDISFLFWEDGSSNLALLDKYTDLFWDRDIISADFPLDPPQKHHASPFYWIIDSAGTIREKLIDYSDKRGVKIDDIGVVLDALQQEEEGGPPSEGGAS